MNADNADITPVAELSRSKKIKRRPRRRWPGVSAGLKPWEARPAHAGPRPFSTRINEAHMSHRRPVMGACVTIRWRDGSGWRRACCQDGG